MARVEMIAEDTGPSAVTNGEVVVAIAVNQKSRKETLIIILPMTQMTHHRVLQRAVEGGEKEIGTGGMIQMALTVQTTDMEA